MGIDYFLFLFHLKVKPFIFFYAYKMCCSFTVEHWDDIKFKRENNDPFCSSNQR